MITLVAENQSNGNGIVREENKKLYLLRQPVSLDSKHHISEGDLEWVEKQGFRFVEKDFNGYGDLQEYLLDLLDEQARIGGKSMPSGQVLEEYIKTLPLPALEVYIEELQEASRVKAEEPFVRLVLKNIYQNPVFEQLDQSLRKLVNAIHDQIARQDQEYLNSLFEHLPADNAIHQGELDRSFSFAA